MKQLIQFFTNNRLFGDLVCIFVVVLGVLSMFQIRREVFPNVQFDVITVTTIYPGASPIEVEKLVTNPIEQDLQEVDGVKKLTSSSIEGRSVIVIQLDPSQTTEQEAKDEVKSVIDRIEFPEDSKEPIVVALKTKQQPIMQVSLSSDGPEMKLREVAKKLEKKIESVPGVARVAYTTLPNLEINVDASPEKLRAMSISLDELIQAIKAQNNSIPAGTLDPDPSATNGSEKIVRTIGEYDLPEDVENTVIRANEIGRGIRVKDVAKVYFDLEKRTTITKTNGHLSLSLTVIKKENADAINVVDNVRSAVDEFQKQPQEISFAATFIDDMSKFVRNRLSILSSNLLLGIFLVCIILTLFLPFKVSLVVSAGIIISFFGTMAYFNLANYSLNLISLLGIIIVSGMLVDDAMVVTDNIARYIQQGVSPKDAAIRGTQEIWAAVTASVLTTVVAFLPMMFMSGIFGKFVRQIPLGVVTALSISLLQALLILPQHVANYISAAEFERPKVLSGVTKLRFRFLDFWDKYVVEQYVRIVGIILRRRYLAVFGATLLLVVTVTLSQVFLKFILFPPEGVEVFFIRTQSNSGITLEQAAERMKIIEKVVGTLPPEELESYVTNIGIVRQDPDDPNTKRGSEHSQVVVYLTPENKRRRTASAIIEDVRAQIGSPKEFVEVRFDRVNPGPPVGKPVSVEVRGETYEEILPAVAALKEKVKAIEGVFDVSDSHISGKAEIQITPIGNEAAAAGLSVASIGTTVRAAVDGIVATSIQKLDEEVDVRVSLDNEGRSPSQVISQIQIPNRSGSLVPLQRVAKIEETQGIVAFQHSANTREVKVTADVDTDKTSSTTANNYIREKIMPDFLKEFPKVQLVFGGEDEDTQESLRSLGRAFIVAFMAIFLILILTFRNLLQPFLVVLTIPMGITSVLLALMINRQPLSFMAMLGVIALAGVIVNNAIVFIDFVNRERSEGVGKIESILSAARIRLRPIFLTTITTVVGLLPTAHGIGGLDKFVVPIAMSLGYGLLFGSILTAFLFPAAIAILDDIEDYFKSKFSSKKESAPGT